MRKLWLRIFAVAVTLFAVVAGSAADSLKTRNVFLIISDGYRWQEVFTGADDPLISLEFGGVKDTNALRAKFWRPTPEARRATLMPFFWSEIAHKGQLLGNQNKGSFVRVSNERNFSYPGYNEIVTGFADPRIDSNAKKLNPNTNVFEWIERHEGFRGKVGIIGTWDVFPYIFNCDRSKLPIWPAWGETFATEIKVADIINKLVADTARIGHDVVHDSFAIHASWEYIRREKPRLGFIGFGETDEFAHQTHYDQYLLSAQRVDRFVGELWAYFQSMPEYRDQTTLIVTADHGRGKSPITWRGHGSDIPESDGDWIAILGPDTPALGERTDGRNNQAQIASTIAALLGLDYNRFFSQAGTPIHELIGASR